MERDQKALDVIEANLDATGLGSSATVLRGDATQFAQPIDVAFVDPPYEFDGWSALLDRLDADVVVLESDRELDVGAKWLLNKARRYGGTVVTLMERKGRT